MHRSSVVRRSSKGPGFGVCVYLLICNLQSHCFIQKYKNELFTCLLFFSGCCLASENWLVKTLKPSYFMIT